MTMYFEKKEDAQEHLGDILEENDYNEDIVVKKVRMTFLEFNKIPEY